MDDTAVVRAPLARLRGLLALLRPKQWIKNGFVFAPLVFAGEFLDGEAVTRAMLAFVLFCLASSAAYIVNDLKDIERDRLHPKKSRQRPLAAGIVTPRQALFLLAILYGIIVFGGLSMPKLLAVLASYLLLNLAYTVVLKHQPVVDIFIIAIGFVLRVYAGAVALSVPVSDWMFITTLCLALYLAAVKRRQELQQTNKQGRMVLERYSIRLVDRYAEMSATGALVFYSMFVMSARPQLVVTVPLVLFGLFRYWYVVEEQEVGESPTDALLADWQLLATGVAWIAVCGWVLWPGKG